MNIRTALLLLLASLALAACGNKGPLVLPDETEAEAAYDDASAEDDAGEAGDAEAGEPTPVADDPREHARR